MRQIEFFDSEISEVERLIAQAALESGEIKRLMSVPGVNVIVAASFMAAIGDITASRVRASSPATSGWIRGCASPASHPRHGHIKAGLHQGAPRAGPGVLDDGAPARSPSRLLSAHPSTPRALSGDRRGRAQARVPVLVSAHPRRGLRLPAALADQEEAHVLRSPPARSAIRRRPPGSGAPMTRSDRPSASSPAKPRSPTHAPLATGMQPRR